ncbi:PA14 domain-containing protein [Enhygromyxa salina]|uniref:PA14 domain protein n=1 Tax=Enhygromyxa salina TaxID=215803 RepID=A0A2S9Y650_9BACT|nr:PA14 domain-containing protein [Enhygromyxa salina]PRQ00580.1 PA14 domain protein [Enhygromyxa salina]
MADPSQANAKLSSQPGWAELCRAADDLHAAELLLQDPLAPARTAVPHLQEFWRSMHEAGRAATLGAPSADDPGAWLAGEITGVDARTREQLANHWRALSAAQLDVKQLESHARLARQLLQTLEPILGGGPLRTRRRRVLWTSVGLLMLFTPVLTYVALTAEIEGEGPWRASYFSDRKLEGSPINQRELSVDHDWGKDAPHEAVPPDKFSIRWDTCLRIDDDQTAPVIFQLNANDGARVFVDGESLIDGWERDSGTRRRGMGTGELTLTPGLHHLRVEYFESMGSASIKLAVSFDDSAPAPLSHDRLVYPGDEFDEEDPCAAVR